MVATTHAVHAAAHYRGRGIHYFAGRVRCPLAGVGSRADDASNRLALEHANTEVTIDRAAGRITVCDERAYRERTVVADLMFLAEGETASGERSPFSIHLKVLKTGHRYSIDLHRHLRKPVRMVRAIYEPFEVVVLDRGRTEVVFDRRRVEQMLGKPALALRLVKALMTLHDHDEGEPDPGRPGFRVADFSLGFGALGLEYRLLRAQLISLDAANAPLIAQGSLAEMMREGRWELKLTALSEKWLPELVQRDLFMYGLEDVPLLRELRTRGMRKDQTLAFRFSRGFGEIVVDGVAAPLPSALDVARAYAEFHLLGGLLAERAERCGRR